MDACIEKGLNACTTECRRWILAAGAGFTAAELMSKMPLDPWKNRSGYLKRFHLAPLLPKWPSGTRRDIVGRKEVSCCGRIFS